MADQQRPGAASRPGVIEDDDLALEVPDRGSADELLDAGAHAPLDLMRHSAAHVMAEAVLALFPGARLGIGPAVADGFYYDFELPRPLTPDDLAAVEERMRASIAADHPFVRRELSFDEARALVAAEDQSEAQASPRGRKPAAASAGWRRSRCCSTSRRPCSARSRCGSCWTPPW